MKTKHIIDTLKRLSLSHVKTTPLGRWNNHNYNQTILKIKYANEDNCGVCCGNYNNTKNNTKNNTTKNNNTKNNNLDDNDYIYMMGYESVCDY